MTSLGGCPLIKNPNSVSAWAHDGSESVKRHVDQGKAHMAKDPKSEIDQS